MVKRILLILIPLLSLLIYLNLPKENALKIGNTKIPVEIADTEEKQIKGLSTRVSLDPNSGMFFVYSNASVRSIWMKDMNFGIDVIWIRDGIVVKINTDVSPQGLGQPIVSSEESVDSFLEVNTGFVRDNQLKIGDSVTLLSS